MIKRLLIVMILVFAITEVSAQLTDLARLEYTYFPQEDSDNSFRRFRTFVNVPIKVGDDSYLVPGFEYRNVNLKFNDDVPFSKKDLDRFQSFKVSLGYTFKLHNDWRFGAQGAARVASNFSQRGGGFVSDDLLFTGGIYFIKDKTDEGAKKPWRLIIGAQYNTSSGRPFPLPFINYYREFHPDWSYTIGIPKSNIRRYLGSKNQHVLQAFVTLDGFYANIQENTELIPQGNNTSMAADNISMTVLLSGLGYEYQFTKHLVFYVYAGYTILNDIRLRDANDDDVFTINDKNSFYARSGIKFKI